MIAPMQPEIQDEAAAGRREYAFARAYTEARARLTRRVLQVKLWTFLLLALAPFGYGALLPKLSDNLSAGWMQAWTEATAGLGRLLIAMLPGLAAGSRAIYGDDPQALAAFLHFASIDVLCIFAMLLFVFGAQSTLHWVPRPGGAQHAVIQNIARGFPRPFGFAGDRRVGGAAGGLIFALMLAALCFGGLYAVYIHPAATDGSLFRDAHYYCAEWRGWFGRARCIQHSERDLAGTIWKLGWMSSLAAVLVPGFLWTGIVSLSYSLWLIGRPTNDSQGH